MSITDNTTALRSILSTVNALPEAGGGTTTQIASGTFETDTEYGYAAINCGFNPDIIFVTQNATYNGYTNSACFAFSAAESEYICAGTWSIEGAFLEFYVDRTLTGAEIWAGIYDESWGYNAYAGTFSYVAVKYT